MLSTCRRSVLSSDFRSLVHLFARASIAPKSTRAVNVAKQEVEASRAIEIHKRAPSPYNLYIADALKGKNAPPGSDEFKQVVQSWMSLLPNAKAKYEKQSEMLKSQYELKKDQLPAWYQDYKIVAKNQKLLKKELRNYKPEFPTPPKKAMGAFLAANKTMLMDMDKEKWERESGQYEKKYQAEKVKFENAVRNYKPSEMDAKVEQAYIDAKSVLQNLEKNMGKPDKITTKEHLKVKALSEKSEKEVNRAKIAVKAKNDKNLEDWETDLSVDAKKILSEAKLMVKFIKKYLPPKVEE